MTQHTLEPWYWNKEDYLAHYGVITGATFETICRVARTNQEANAHLIAAAPALLAAANSMASVLRNFTIYNGIIPDDLVVLAQEAMRRYLAAIEHLVYVTKGAR